jgi:hypothetical protein
MFGYIRPLQGELKVRELEHFKACYCGLCHALGAKYGITARFILNYELVFLAMLLWDSDGPPEIKRRRCIASPFRKKCYCTRNKALDTCAGYSVILTWWKLRDTISDESFFKTIPYRFVSFILYGAYKKAVREFADFSATVKQKVTELSEYEKNGEKSLDGAADSFARILCAATPDNAPEKMRRPLEQMLYHLGRWIYILDACDDYSDDAGAGRYNPIALLYPADQGMLSDESLSRLKTTLVHSNNLMCSAYELLSGNYWTQTVGNIIYLGMHDVSDRVLEGNWPPKRQPHSACHPDIFN